MIALPEARFNLELKEAASGMVERTVEVIAEAGREHTTLVTTADDDLMRDLREHVDAQGVDLALGACTGEVAGFAVSALRGESPPEGPMALQIPGDFSGHPLVTPELIAHAHAHDVHVHAWTIDEPEEMARLLDLGVDGIVTNFPARMVRLLATRS